MKRFLLFVAFTFIASILANLSAQNLVLNGGFETWSTAASPTPSNWTIVQPANGSIASNSNVIEGAKSCKISVTGASYTITQSVKITAGKTYSLKMAYNVMTSAGSNNDVKLQCSYRTATAAIPMTLEDSLALKGPGGANSYLPTTPSTWKTYNYDIIAPANATTFVFTVTVSRGATVFFDDFSLVENTLPSIYMYTYSVAGGFNYTPTLKGFDYAPNLGPSSQQSFTVKAVNLTGSLTITAPSNFEISIGSGASFVGTSSISIAPNGSTIAPLVVYTRLKSGLAIGSYSGNITLSAAGAVKQSIPVSGTVSLPPVIINSSVSALSGFSYVEGSGPSAQQSFTVSGSNLSTGITLSVPANFELSVLSGAAFSGTSSLTLPQNGGSVANTTIYVRLKAGQTAASYANTISLITVGATVKTISLTGTVTPMPGINVSANSLSGFNYLLGAGPSNVQTFNVSASQLTNYLIVSGSSDFEISADGGADFTPTGQIIISPISGVVTSTPIYVRLKADLAKGNYTESIIVSSSGMANKTVSVSGAVSIFTSTDETLDPVISVTKTTSGILVHGVPLNEPISVYSLTGVKISSTLSNGTSTFVNLTKGGVYIVYCFGKSIKVII